MDHLRRGRMLERKHEMVAQEMEAEQQAMPDLDSALDDNSLTVQRCFCFRRRS